MQNLQKKQKLRVLHAQARNRQFPGDLTYCRQTHGTRSKEILCLPKMPRTNSAFQSVLVVFALLVLLSLSFDLSVPLGLYLPHNEAQIEGNAKEADTISANNKSNLEGTSATVTAAAVVAEKGSRAGSVQCMDLNLNQGMDSLVARAHQIFITMPTKGGGSSMNTFTRRCNNITKVRQFGFIGNDDQKELLVGSMQGESIISSHVSKDTGLIRLAMYPSQKTLMIHIHREEGERVISAVKMISHHMCRMNYQGPLQYLYKPNPKGDCCQHVYNKTVITKNETHCILDAESMVDWIAKGHREVGGGAPKVLTCKLYDALQENAPQLVFLNYKQIDKLQTLLAKHHCPELLDELPIKINVADDKEQKIFLYDGNHEKGAVRIEEWLDAKGPVLEWALNLRSEASCQAKTIHMEDELFGCPDEALKVTPESIKKW